MARDSAHHAKRKDDRGVAMALLEETLLHRLQRSRLPRRLARGKFGGDGQCGDEQRAEQREDA
jgi:hypothetical protein